MRGENKVRLMVRDAIAPIPLPRDAFPVRESLPFAVSTARLS